MATHENSTPVQVGLQHGDRLIYVAVDKETAKSIQSGTGITEYAKLQLYDAIDSNDASTPATGMNTSNTAPIPGENEQSADASQGGAHQAQFHWTRIQVLLLIDLWVEHADYFASDTYPKKQVWNMIGNKIRQRGYAITDEQMKNKWKNLKKAFRKASEDDQKDWKYFNAMETAIGRKPELQKIGRKPELRRTGRKPEYQEIGNKPVSQGTRKRQLDADDAPPKWFRDFLSSLEKRNESRDKDRKRLIDLLEKLSKK